MRRTSLVLFFGALVCASLQAVPFPQLAVGGGYECVIIVTSKVQAPFEGDLILREGNGAEWSTPFQVNGQPSAGAAIDVNLPALGTAKYVLTGGATYRVGYLEVYGSGPHTGDDIAVAVFYNYHSGGHIVDSVGVPRSYQYLAQLFPVERSAAVDTAFAWARFGITPAFDVTLTLYNAQGTQVQQKTVAFEGHTAKFFSEVFDNVPNGFVGHVRATSPQAIAIAVLRLDLTRLQLTSTPSTMVAQ